MEVMVANGWLGRTCVGYGSGSRRFRVHICGRWEGGGRGVASFVMGIGTRTASNMRRCTDGFITLLSTAPARYGVYLCVKYINSRLKAL